MDLERMKRALIRLLTYRGRSARLESIVTAAFLVFSVLIISGFLYVLIAAPPALYGTRPIFPSVTGQTIVEFVLVALAYSLSFLGLYVIHLTAIGRFSVRRGAAVWAGIGLFALGILMIISILAQKIGA
ncbi:MAG: hypothetical protein QXP81_07820 [Nitrososphaerota archaeon]|nr:hypothetical protein [Candidatus Calditenuis fumarioli]